MKLTRALPGLTILLIVAASPALGGEPKLNVDAICRSREADARILRSTPDQTLSECAHDENAAKEQLASIWPSTSTPVRKQCEADARSLGTTSYLDLLTCIQMEQNMKSGAKKP